MCPTGEESSSTEAGRGPLHAVAGGRAHVDYVVYGKIIIDAIRRKDGVVVKEMLGGGGPQGAFGARIWDESVGLLTRTGSAIEPKALATLESLDIDLQGWYTFPQHKTPHSGMEYDENEYMKPRTQIAAELEILSGEIRILLAEDIPIPPAYETPRVIHLITEFYHDTAYFDALRLKAEGAVFSMEPLIDYRRWSNREETLAGLHQWDLMSPDWPSASGIAGSTDPATVLRFWADAAREAGPHVIAVRDGARGSYVWERAGDRAWHVPPAPVNVVDPTGAGNAYGGGLMVGWDKTHDARMAACYGAVSSSLVIETTGLPPWSDELVPEAKRRLEALLKRVEPL